MDVPAWKKKMCLSQFNISHKYSIYVFAFLFLFPHNSLNSVICMNGRIIVAKCVVYRFAA